MARRRSQRPRRVQTSGNVTALVASDEGTHPVTTAGLPAPAATSALIQDQVRVGTTPGAPNVGRRPEPGVVGTISADVRQEYVSAGFVSFYKNYPRVLSWSIDDVSRDFGDDIYDRMLLDDQVSSVVGVLKTGILEDGVRLTPAVEDEDADGYALAAELVELCERALDETATAFDDVLWDLMSGMAYGNRVAEQVYHLEGAPSGRQELTLRNVMVTPRRSTAFLVDTYNNVLGLMGLVPGYAVPVQVGLILTDVQHQGNLLPREKFAVLTYRPKDGDPRGTSVLRPAFDAWWSKVQLAPEFIKFLTQFGAPSLIGHTAPEASEEPQLDADGNPTFDANGNPLLLNPEQQMLNALTAFRSGTALVFPDGADVRTLEILGDGNVYLKAFERYDRRITKAILYQTLATEEGQHQTRAAAGTHRDVLTTIIRQGKKSVRRLIRHDILRPLVRYNYGDAALPLVPHVSLGETEQEDLAGTLQALGYVGYTVDASQFPGIDAMLSLPERDPASLTAPDDQELGSASDDRQKPVQPTAAAGAGTPAKPAAPGGSAQSKVTAKGTGR